MESPQSLPNSPNSSQTYVYLLEKYGLVISWEDAAKETGVFWETLRRLCARGEIPIEKPGKSWMLTTKALADYIDYGPVSRWRKDNYYDVFDDDDLEPKQKRGFFKYVRPKPMK